MTDLDIPEVQVGYDFHKITLPLKVNTISFVNSKDVIQVQIADMLVSSCAYWARSIVNHSEEDDLFFAIRDSIISDLIINSIWPNQAVTPKELGILDEGGINPLNQVEKLLRRQQKKNK